MRALAWTYATNVDRIYGEGTERGHRSYGFERA